MKVINFFKKSVKTQIKGFLINVSEEKLNVWYSKSGPDHHLIYI
jgi:hypothetical protein